MDTQELPQEEWSAFFDEVSRQYNGGQVMVTVKGEGLPGDTVISGLPLLGVQLNTKGSDAGSITVIAGQSADDAISHTIMGATQVSVMRTSDGAVDTVQIAAPDPAQTRIQFQSAS